MNHSGNEKPSPVALRWSIGGRFSFAETVFQFEHPSFGECSRCSFSKSGKTKQYCVDLLVLSYIWMVYATILRLHLENAHFPVWNGEQCAF
jgi:hypothetical protein